jgi:hypothetical protein
VLPDVTFDDCHYNSFDDDVVVPVVVVQRAMMAKVVGRRLVVDGMDQMTSIWTYY